MTYYKAIRPDGTDFHTGTVQWAPESGDIPTEGIVVAHPTSTAWEKDHSTHLCASAAPADCAGFNWPCRLLALEPVSEVHRHAGSKRSALSWRVVRELPAVEALGPQGAAVVALVDGLGRLDAAEIAALVAARDAAREAAWDAAGDAAWYAAWYAAREAAWDAAREAAWYAAGDAAREAAWYAAWYAAGDAAGAAAAALVAWDLITPGYRDILTAPIRTALPDLWADVTAHLPHEKEAAR